MSSWKAASKAGQKPHRERRQPSSRAHLGLLEKKKDYKERAKNYNEKRETLKVLKKRVLNRNPDEFYFHMINSRVEDGVHRELEKDDEHTPEQIMLMQSQDLNYVSMRRVMEARKIEKLKSQLHLLDVANKTKNKHTFFVDTKKEAKTFDVAERLDTHPSLIARRVNRPRLSDLKTASVPSVDEKRLKELTLEKSNAYKELYKRIEREKQLTIIQQKLEIKRRLQSKKDPTPKRVKPGTKDSAPVYEWTFERKR